LWDAVTGRELRPLAGHTGAVYAVAFSPDGARALSGGNDRIVRLWDLDGGRELTRFAGHANAGIRVAFPPGGPHAPPGSSQYRAPARVIRVWDPATGRELQGLGTAEDEAVGCLAFAPDGRGALSGGPGGALRLWRWSK